MKPFIIHELKEKLLALLYLNNVLDIIGWLVIPNQVIFTIFLP